MPCLALQYILIWISLSVRPLYKLWACVIIAAFWFFKATRVLSRMHSVSRLLRLLGMRSFPWRASLSDKMFWWAAVTSDFLFGVGLRASDSCFRWQVPLVCYLFLSLMVLPGQCWLRDLCVLVRHSLFNPLLVVMSQQGCHVSVIGVAAEDLASRVVRCRDCGK